MSSNPTFSAPHYFAVDSKKTTAAVAAGATKLPSFTTSTRASACWSFGPLEVCADYNNNGIDVEIKLLGQRIGGGRLDQNNATISVGVDLGVAKAGVTLTADFGKRELVAQGEVCVRNWFGQWECSGFNAVILRW